MTPESPHAGERSTRHFFLPLLGYLALASAFYAPILLGLRWFPTGDFTDHFLPFSLFQRSEILAGRLPIWNPYTFSGHPFLADVQAAVFYPISNLVLALTLAWSGIMQRLYWLQVEVILQIALGGFFTFLLVRELVWQTSAAFLAGCVFAFSGYLTGYPPLQTAVLRTAIWLPLILWCLRRAFLDQGSWRWWVAAAIAYAVAFLGGHPQTFLFLSYCVGGWLLLQILITPAPRWAWLPRIAAFFALFLGLSAAQLWPSLEFTALSVRAGVEYAFASGGFHASDTLQVLAAGVLTHFSPLYVGLVALGLALLACTDALASLLRPAAVRPPGADGGRAQAYTVIFFGLLAVLALMASYGDNGFLYPILYRWAPGWSMFRGQERAAYLVAFSLSVLAGYGVAVFAKLTRRARIAATISWAVVAGAGLLAFGLIVAPSLDAVARAALTRGYAVAAIALLGLVLLALLRLDPRRYGAVLTALVLVELFASNAPVNLGSRPELPPAEAVAMAGSASAVASATGDVADAPPRVHNEGRLPEDYGMFVGVEDVGGSSPLRIARYDSLLHDFPRVRLWQLTGVQTVLSSGDTLYVPSDRLADFTGASEPAYLYRLGANYPRAWVVNSLYTADDHAALPLLGDERLDLRQTAVLPPAVNGVGRPVGLEDGSLAAAGASDVRIERRSPTDLRIQVNTEAGGYLVVSENWMPGWEATILSGGERREAAVLRTDLTLLGLAVPAGDSTVELRYRPASVRFGLLISALTLASLFAGILLSRRERAHIFLTHWAKVLPWDALGTAAVILVAYGLRVYRLGYQELRGDEALGRLFSMQSVGDLVRSTLALREPHPVASYAIEGAWLHLAGQTEFALRFVSVWFGVLAVVLLYRLVREMRLSKPAGILAGGLLAVSPYAVWHSQDARMYSISLALTLASTVLMLRALGRRRWVLWAAYVAVTWLALQTHYYAAYIVVAQNLFVFTRAVVSRDERRSLPAWVAAQVVTGLLYLPWLIAARTTLSAYAGNGDSPGFVGLWLRSLAVFAAGETMPAELRTPLAVLAGLLALCGAMRLFLSGSAGRRALWLALLILLVPLLTTWLGAISRPIFNERYIIAALPGFLVLVAAAFAPLADRPDRFRKPVRSAVGGIGGLLALALAGIMLLSLWHFYDDPAYSKSRGWRELTAVMARYAEGLPPSAARVAQSYPDPTLWYYYRGGAEQTVIPPAAHDQAGAEALVGKLAQQGVERVVIAVQDSAAWDDREIAPNALKGAYDLLQEVPVSGWRVQVYGRPPESLEPVNVTFANGVELTAAHIMRDRLLPGDVLPVYLRWQGRPEQLSGSEKVTLQLLNAEGKLVAQVDQPFGPRDLSANPAQYSIALSRMLPAGGEPAAAYRLILALYDPSKEGAPRVLTADGADHVELKTFASP